MAEEKNYKTIYADGNLAPQIDYVPQVEVEPAFRPKVIDGKKKNPFAIKRDVGYNILLIGFIVFFIGICVIYLKSTFLLVVVQTEVNQLKGQLEKVRTDNSIIEQNINNTIDLNKAYDIAVNKLKMRLPEKNEIHYVVRKAESYTVKLNQKSESKSNSSFMQFILFILKDW